MNSVLLTVDLTKAVADEAIERKDSIVVAYRIDPPSSLCASASIKRPSRGSILLTTRD